MAAVATVHDDDALADNALVCKRNKVGHRDPFVICLCVGGDEIPAEVIFASMAGEVEQGHFSWLAEQVCDGLAQFSARYGMRRRNQLSNVEVLRPVGMAVQKSR